MTEQTILIVEDDPDIRDGVRILLAGEGYRILEAENGAKALQTFSPEGDLVIPDVMMPGMSGLRVCEELRQRSTVPILFLTAKAQESDKLVGLTAGGDDYLAKPLTTSATRASPRPFTIGCHGPASFLPTASCRSCSTTTPCWPGCAWARRG